MIKMTNIPITGKFITVIAAFGAIYIASIFYAATVMHAIEHGFTAAAEQQGQAVIHLTAAGRSLNGVRAAMGDLQISTTDEGNLHALADIKDSRAQFIAAVNAAQKADASYASEIAAVAAQGLGVIDQTCDKAVKMGLAATQQADIMVSQAEYLQSCSPAFLPLLKALKVLYTSTEAAQHEVQRNLSNSTNQSIIFNYIAAVAALAVMSAATFFGVRSWISRPLARLVETMKSLAGGNLQTEIDGTSRKDEIGPMAQAVRVFRDNGLKLRAAEHEAAAQRDAATRERAANEATSAEIQRQQALVVNSIAEGLTRLAKGDLTNRLKQAFSSEYEKLRSDFNVAAESLQDALRTIAQATDGITAGSNQIAHASDDLSRRTEQQAANLEETAAALHLITGTVRTMAAGASEAANVALTAKGAAETSSVIVQQAVDAMGKIKESSNQIGNIIGVIDEIAFQTNLLALNAGVEAARAGDAGRGFAVVASEVRALAQRSAEAAKQIKALISSSTAQVESGVVLVDKTGVALKEIAEKVEEMDALVRQISASSKEQATGLAEINTAVSQMDQAVQQNAAMVEESTAAAHSLKSETEGLTTMVGRFQLGGARG